MRCGKVINVFIYCLLKILVNSDVVAGAVKCILMSDWWKKMNITLNAKEIIQETINLNSTSLN